MIRTRQFHTGRNAREWHSIITPDDKTAPFDVQLKDVCSQYASLLSETRTKRPVMCRWFLSDIHNQRHLLPETDCATSVVGQPPLDCSKVTLWIWLMEGVEVKPVGEGRYGFTLCGIEHFVECDRHQPGVDSLTATVNMLEDTQTFLEGRGGSLIDSCVRTWFFVRDVDVNYAGVVRGRNDVFRRHGLSPATRFIASTGIGGSHPQADDKVGMDSYSAIGLPDGAMKQVNAPDHLNPTHEYGVAFERACTVDYPDRRHMFISGTASIDNHGNVVWPCDIRRQTQRMLENVDALLRAGDMKPEDVAHYIVYLRDAADFAVVREIMESRCRHLSIPFIIVLAPVCRPEWLIETECMACSR